MTGTYYTVGPHDRYRRTYLKALCWALFWNIGYCCVATEIITISRSSGICYSDSTVLATVVIKRDTKELQFNINDTSDIINTEITGHSLNSPREERSW